VTQIVGSNVLLTVSVYDQYRNLVSDYDGTAGLQLTGAATPNGVFILENGQANVNITSTTSEVVTVALTDPAATGFNRDNTSLTMSFGHGKKWAP